MNILARYIITHYLGVFAACLGAATGLFLVIDFFQRISSFSRYGADAASVAAYFLFKLPSMITEVYPAVALISVLIALGLMSRHHEVLALRACGVSTWQLAAPLLALTAAISVGVMVWNESIVPAAATRAKLISDVDIKKKSYRGIFNATAIWFQSKQGFVNIDYYDANRRAIYGLTLYETDPSFGLNRIIELPVARWRDGRWESKQGTVKNMGPEGEVVPRPLEPGEFELEERPEDFAQRRRLPKEFSFRQMSRQIEILADKGLSAEELGVDLHLKLAWPMSGLVMVAVGFPLALRGGRRAGLGANAALGLAVGFAYWVTMAVAISAGRSGGLPPMAAAWAANGLFAALAGSLYLGKGG